MITATSITALELLRSSTDLRTQLRANSERFRSGMEAVGFTLAGADHPIIPVMLGDAKLASEMADRLLSRGIYVIGFSFPVVPRGEARIRTQMSAAHTETHIDQAVAAFTDIGRELGVI
jgi:glycine C-acetyltransferase